jgi:PAS domain-containing protein
VTINQPSLDVASEELNRVEELVRYLAAHDGRLPTDDMPLAWWALDVLDGPRSSPVHRLLQDIPLRDLSRPFSPGRAATWAKFVQRLDQLDWMEYRGETLDDTVTKDLETWAQSAVVRYLSGSMKPTEELLLRKRPVWSFERPLSGKRRNQAAWGIGLREVKAFHRTHGHTDIPEDLIVEGVPVRLWWKQARDRYAGNGLKPHDRQRLEGLKLDLRSDGELAKAEKRKAAEERHRQAMENRQRAKEGVIRAIAERRGVDDIRPVLKAIRSFADQYGHTGIPVGAVTEEDGIEFGRFVDQWRRMYAARGRQFGGDRELRDALESIPQWTWMRTPASPTVQRPAPVAIPEDTTQMNRSGLRQFLPAD